MCRFVIVRECVERTIISDKINHTHASKQLGKLEKKPSPRS